MVAIGAPYATLSELKREMGIADSNTTQDALLATKLAGATADINRYCHRQFGRDEVASARMFDMGSSGVDVDDIWDRADITVTPYLGQVAGTPWTVGTYVRLEPLNGIVDGVPGWPVTRLAYAYPSFFSWGSLSSVQVTAKWGWAAVPDDVKQACLLLANSGMNAKNAPFGVAAFGDYAVRIRQNPMAGEKLEPYRIDQVWAAS